VTRVVVATALAIALAWRARRQSSAERIRSLSASPARALTVPRPIAQIVGRALARADLRVSPPDALVAWWAAIIALGILGVALGGYWGALVGALAAGAAGPALLFVWRRRREERLRAALPDLLDDVARDLRAGGTVVGAIERLARLDSTLGVEAEAIRRRLALGLGIEESLASWARSHEHSLAERAVRSSAAALHIAVVSGGRGAPSLQGLAVAMRDDARMANEARAQAAQGRLSALLLGMLPLGSLGFSALFDAESTTVLVGTPLGRACLAAGLAFEVAGLVWMRRVVRVPA